MNKRNLKPGDKVIINWSTSPSIQERGVICSCISNGLKVSGYQVLIYGDPERRFRDLPLDMLYLDQIAMLKELFKEDDNES